MRSLERSTIASADWRCTGCLNRCGLERQTRQSPLKKPSEGYCLRTGLRFGCLERKTIEQDHACVIQFNGHNVDLRIASRRFYGDSQRAHAPDTILHGVNLSELPAGTTINDRYELTRHLGHGAGGSVYEAHDRHLDTSVAVKLLKPDDSTSGPWHEARLLQKLQSRYLLSVLNADIVIDSDLRFIVTPVLEGGDMESFAKPHGLAPSTVARYIQQAASGLDRIHRAGMVHRDIKPGNVFVQGGTAVIGDLGFCHLLEGGVAPPNGSFCTVAPEVLHGDGRCSPASDVYSLAATTFFLLCGEYPIDHKMSLTEQRAQIMAGSVRELRTIAPHVSRAVGAVVRKSLSSDPTKRHANATDFGTALAGAIQGCRDWHRTTHNGHLHCITGASHGQKKEIQVCSVLVQKRSIEVSARLAGTGRQVPGRPNICVTPGQLMITLQQLTAAL